MAAERKESTPGRGSAAAGRRAKGIALGAALVLAGQPAAGEPQLTGTNRADCASEIRRDLAKTRNLREDTWASRFVAAALAQKVAFADGKAVYPVSVEERPFMVVGEFGAIESAVNGTALPREYKDLLLKHLGGLFLYPIRQHPPRIGVKAWQARVGALPADSAMVTVGPGDTLAGHVARVYPPFDRLSGLRKQLVFRALAEVNPLVQPVGAYVADAASPEVRRGTWRTDAGPELENLQLQCILYEIDPGTRLMPAPAASDGPNGEALAAPVGGGKVRVCIYRIPVGARVLIPGPSWLARQSAPDALDLSNGWIRDLSVVDDLDVAELDLRGNDVSDVGPLARKKKLCVLRLDHNPVADLSPLRGLPLTQLTLADTPVVDLSPLRGLALEKLVLRGTRATDLAPLRNMPLKHLELDRMGPVDLTPLSGLPLEYLRLEYAGRYAGLETLDGMGSLAAVSDVPKRTWVEEYGRFQQSPDVVAPGDDCEPPEKKAAAPEAGVKEPPSGRALNRPPPAKKGPARDRPEAGKRPALDDIGDLGP